MNVLGASAGWLSQSMPALAVIGFLGGATTMGAFTYETVARFGPGAGRRRVSYVVANVWASPLATWVGAGIGVGLAAAP